MHRVRAANRLLASLREAKESDLPLADQIRHDANDVLDGNSRVDAVLIEEVNAVSSEAAERALDGLANMLGPAIQARHRAVLDLEPELGRDSHAIALTRERASEQFLVGIRPVHLGRIKERDAKLDGPVDGGDGLAPVALFGGSVSKAHPHAAQPERRHFQVISKSSLLHFQFLSRSEVKFISQSEVEAILVRICRGSLTRSCSTCRDITRKGGSLSLLQSRAGLRPR